MNLPPLSRFEIWRGWIRDLGGTYEPVRDLSEPKPVTGRRDPDTKPRWYPLNDEVYGQDPRTGAIWRRENR